MDAEAVLVECGTNRNVLVRSIEKPEVKERVKEYHNAKKERKEKKERREVPFVDPTRYNTKHPAEEERLNVIFLNFDAVARSHFHRRFLKSKEFITG